MSEIMSKMVSEMILMITMVSNLFICHSYINEYLFRKLRCLEQINHMSLYKL